MCADNLTQEETRPKSIVVRALYRVRDFRSRALFRALRRYSRGSVLDVGGWDFVVTAIDRRVPFDRWTVLDIDPHRIVAVDDQRLRGAVH